MPYKRRRRTTGTSTTSYNRGFAAGYKHATGRTYVTPAKRKSMWSSGRALDLPPDQRH
jgi:hypothetical protein